jgi:hypothetical protein
MSTSAGWSSSLVHRYQSLRQRAVDLARLLLLAAKSRTPWRPKTYFSGSSWPCFKNVKFNLGVEVKNAKKKGSNRGSRVYNCSKLGSKMEILVGIEMLAGRQRFA